jgi:DNA-binding NtrC family response regulator
MTGSGGGAPQLLLADRDSAFSQSLAQHLSSMGWQVEQVESGKETLLRLDERAFDALIVDLQLAQPNGVELIEHLAGRPRSPAAILLANSVDVPTAVRAMRAGAVDVLEKPVTAATIDERLRTSLPDGLHDTEPSDGVESGTYAMSIPRSEPLRDLERRLILESWESCGRKLSAAAASLGMPRTTLRDRLKKYGVR